MGCDMTKTRRPFVPRWCHVDNELSQTSMNPLHEHTLGEGAAGAAFWGGGPSRRLGEGSCQDPSSNKDETRILAASRRLASPRPAMGEAGRSGINLAHLAWRTKMRAERRCEL